MYPSQAKNVYKNAATQAQVHPVKLIHLIYERVLLHLEGAIDGVEKKNPGKRGENIGKAIALITELNVAVKVDEDPETGHFLQGLYTSILVELPKAAMNNDAGILRRAHAYFAQLKAIWEQTAMKEHGFSPNVPAGAHKVGEGRELPGGREADHPPTMSRVSVAI